MDLYYVNGGALGNVLFVQRLNFYDKKMKKSLFASNGQRKSKFFKKMLDFFILVV